MSKTIEEYALSLVIDGATSYIEDDFDEDGELPSREDWLKARALAYASVDALRDIPEFVLSGACGKLRSQGVES